MKKREETKRTKKSKEGENKRRTYIRGVVYCCTQTKNDEKKRDRNEKDKHENIHLVVGIIGAIVVAVAGTNADYQKDTKNDEKRYRETKRIKKRKEENIHLGCWDYWCCCCCCCLLHCRLTKGHQK